MAQTMPDLVIPTDDPAAQHLHKLCHRASDDQYGKNPIRAVIEHSLGPCENFDILDARTPFMELAEAEGVRSPKTAVVSNLDEVSNWIDRAGSPIVLKANHSSGATGVRIVHSREEAKRAFVELQAPPSLRRTTMAAIAHRDGASFWRSLLRRRSVVNAQVYVAGRDAISEVACWKGRVLASLHFEVLNKQYASGPASVVRLMENEAMSGAIEKIVRRLHLSGLHGFDFILEESTGDPYLLEMNPRATQIGHLTLGPSRDLPAALCAAVSGRPIRHAPKVTEKDTIALFPQEWKRDPMSAFLQSGYHDVPWGDPELVRACIGGPGTVGSFSPRQEKWRRDSSGLVPSRLAAMRRGKLPGTD